MSGRFAILVAFTPLLAGCPAPELPVPIGTAQSSVVDDITYEVQPFSEVTVPVTVGVTARVTNGTEQQRTVEFPDGCVVLLRAYQDPERTGEPDWDQARAVACTQAVVRLQLAAGELDVFETRATSRDILGDSLPTGRYYFSAYLRPDGRTIELPAGQMELLR